MLDASDDDIKKALVTVAIERALIDFGKSALEKVGNKLYDDFQCYFSDCYKHPERLTAILKELFGNSHTVIVESIKKNLDEFSSQKSIKEFLVKIHEKNDSYS